MEHMRKLKKLFVIILSLMVFAVGCNDDSDESNSSVSLVDKADQEVKKIDPGAFVVWGGGRRADGQPMTSPGENDLWNFIAVSLPTDTALAATGMDTYWWMEYDGKAFTVNEVSAPFGIVYTDIGVVTMKASRAWHLCAEAGYTGTFSTWELFQPLNSSATDDPMYAFSMTDGSFVLVNTVTREVTQERQSPGNIRDTWDCLYYCRISYLRCEDNCRENHPGDWECYQGCNESRNECDNGCTW